MNYSSCFQNATVNSAASNILQCLLVLTEMQGLAHFIADHFWGQIPKQEEVKPVYF